MMAKPLVSDELWEVVEPLLPKRRRRRSKRGRPALDDRAALSGILFVLKTGIPWEYPAGDGLRVRHELLAKVARLAQGRRLEAAAPYVARKAPRGGAD